MDANDARQLRAAHFDRLQEALEDGLRAIGKARTTEEAERARLRARRRLEELNRQFQASFPEAHGPSREPDAAVHEAACAETGNPTPMSSASQDD